MYLEPVAPPAVPGTILAHSHQLTFVQTARFARGSRLLVDDALVIVLTLCDGVGIVVCSSEERLKQKKETVSINIDISKLTLQSAVTEICVPVCIMCRTQVNVSANSFL